MTPWLERCGDGTYHMRNSAANQKGRQPFKTFARTLALPRCGMPPQHGCGPACFRPRLLAGSQASRIWFKKAAVISARLPASRACAYRSIALRAERGHSGQACLAFLNPPLAETKFEPHPPALTRGSGGALFWLVFRASTFSMLFF